MKTEIEKLVLFYSDEWGIYIPSQLARDFKKNRHLFKGVSDDVWEDLLGGPECDCYWDSWDIFLNNATMEHNGETYHFYQDGDLWAYLPDHCEWDDMGYLKEVGA